MSFHVLANFIVIYAEMLQLLGDETDPYRSSAPGPRWRLSDPDPLTEPLPLKVPPQIPPMLVPLLIYSLHSLKTATICQ